MEVPRVMEADRKRWENRRWSIEGGGEGQQGTPGHKERRHSLYCLFGATHNLGAKNHPISYCEDLQASPLPVGKVIVKELEASPGKGQQKKKEVERPRREGRGGDVFLLMVMVRERKMETSPEVGFGGQDALALILPHCSRLPLF